MVSEIIGPLFPSFAGMGLVMLIVFWGLPIAALVSVGSLSRVAFYQAHSSKAAWIVILAIGLVLTPVGFFFALYYFLGVWRCVRRFERNSDT
jgi:hypothetical protein